MGMMTPREELGMKDFREDFEGFDDSGARSVEELVSVGEKDLAGANGSEMGPTGMLSEWSKFLAGAWDVKATGQNHDDIRIGFLQLCKGNTR